MEKEMELGIGFGIQGGEKGYKMNGNLYYCWGLD